MLRPVMYQFPTPLTWEFGPELFVASDYVKSRCGPDFRALHSCDE